MREMLSFWGFVTIQFIYDLLISFLMNASVSK